ncbi:MAG: cobalamin biosynthesis protein CobD [Lachnospiraceae bacterium]|nr:cobalamin biosynthesis protein CobD [Lachnospiraceae bacterium]
MIYHIIAFFTGFILDLIFGDPHFMPHPIRLIGALIGALEKRWNTEEKTKSLRRGRLLVITVFVITGVVTAVILITCYKLNSYLGLAIESIMTYQILSIKDLRVESMRVYKALKADDLLGARQAVSMIVGRDVDSLDVEGIAKAAIETVAENTSDGCIAPMIYTALGGPILGFLYKAVNTMDSMVGYKNYRYINFGRCAARFDDVVNYIPSRISAYLMIAASFLSGKSYDGKNAYKIYKRDCHKHASPNSAQTESVCAGALGIRLAGDASYFGKLVEKPYIGDATKEVSYEDIRRANHLLYMTAFICEVALILLMVGIICIIKV